MADYVLIDCPAGIEGGFRNAIAGASEAVVVTTPEVSAIRDATWIIVLDEGRIVEQGTHVELLGAGGRYWSLLSRQQLEESIEADEADGELAEAGTEGRINA